MQREPKRDAELTKWTYKKIQAHIPHEAAEKLQAIIDERGITVTAWIKEKIAQDSSKR
ncbi:MAG: hypothetical protein FWD84_02855 [Oscillospiraceae bacterium]|nr:hypothetical protein [Oscillospiraceae bacterium]